MPAEWRKEEHAINLLHVGGTTDVSKKIDKYVLECMDKLQTTMSLGNSSEDETEADAICVSNVKEETIIPDQKSMLSDYVDAPRAQPSAQRGYVFKSIPEPDQKTVILIPHAHQTDTEAGDFFGATLYTYKRASGKKHKYQHLLKDIKYPAQKMRIGEGDELVMIDQTFTPDLDHTDVLNTFHHDVKVDGKTRFCLVLRRSNKKQSNWDWYETSAILHADPRDEAPVVTEEECVPAKPKRYEQKIVFSIYDCSLYMFIDKAGMHGVPIERDDDSIYVNKTVEVSFNPFVSKAALSGMDGTSYVRIDDQRNIGISGDSMCTWFGCETKGSDNNFYVDGLSLSYDKTAKSFMMSNSKGERNCVTCIFKDERRVSRNDHLNGDRVA